MAIHMENESLSSIPGIGPARRLLLEAAGIATRSAFARADVAQIISLTGMPRAQAEQALQAARAVTPPSNGSEPTAAAAPPPIDEAFPDLPAEMNPSALLADATPSSSVPPPPPPAPESEDATPEEIELSELDRAVLKCRTALADATRRLETPRLTRQLTRFALLLDKLPELAARRKPKRVRALARRLESTADFLEWCAASADRTLGREKREERMRQRIKAARAAVRDILRESRKARRSSSPKKR